ncbi:transposable element Tc3 transposase [Trichonephila clavipes]|nr:transposable element Tc3 transposase [Trichonephila clavipes]
MVFVRVNSFKLKSYGAPVKIGARLFRGEDGDRFHSCQVIYSQFGLAIHQNDHQARRRFVEWDQNEIAVVPDFHKRILFSDEAHFWLNGYVNKQNCRIWSEANPQVYVETPLHPEKLTVWCALWTGGIIGPYFFKINEGHNVTVNGDRYRAMITNFFIPELNNHDVQELWFQQDGATCHTARDAIYLLKDTFGDRLISRFGPVNWPPRSFDLTPLDYFLWGYVKSLVYADKPQTLDHLEDNIRRVISDIRPQMLEKVIENWTSRLDYIRANRGSPMPEIIFKIFVEWAQNEIAVVPDFHKRILFSDEAHFWLNGYVNKQNCRIWSEANSQVYVETPLHPEKLTVWCALWAGGILLQKR